MPDGYARKIQSVSEVTSSIRGLIETHYPFISVLGEVSNIRTPFSGHTYFTLKDQQAQLKAVLFKTQQRYLQEKLRDGMQVVCAGRVSVYEQRGEYQLIVDFVDFRGRGLLQDEFEKLKAKLQREGLFDELNKKPLPFLPAKIGLITSPTGAAVFDFLQMAEKLFPAVPIEILPVKVQGDGAAEEVSEAIGLANDRKDCQVIVLCRGGGSLEDLWTFNEESVARAIAASKIPVVSAIGHEIDFTIADFAADHRAATPTAAAETVLPNRTYLKSRLAELHRRLLEAGHTKFDSLRSRVNQQRRMLSDPTAMLQHHMLRLDYTHSAMTHAMRNRLTEQRSRLQRATARLNTQNPSQRLKHRKELLHELGKRFQHVFQSRINSLRNELQNKIVLLDAVSPLAVLARGYSLAKLPDGRLVRSAKQVRTGDRLELQLETGRLDCQVTGVHLKPTPKKTFSSSGS